MLRSCKYIWLQMTLLYLNKWESLETMSSIYLFNKHLMKACLVAVLAVGLVACSSSDNRTTQLPPPEPTAYETALEAIEAAQTAEAAQAAYDAVKGDVTAAQGQQLQAAVNDRVAALAKAASAAGQKATLMEAAGGVDTSSLTTAEDIAAAKSAIAALKAALAAATDVSDADKAMYQGRVDAAETAVANAQSTLDHAAQTTALSGAVEALQAIDLSGLLTQEDIDAAQAAIDALQTALAAATELSDAEKAAAMTELATANRTVMMAQGRTDKAGQVTMLSEAADALRMIDLTDLSTQEKINDATAAITALELALAAATDLTDAEKLDATVDVTVARRAVDAAQTLLTQNVGHQRTAVKEAADALGEIDLDDLDTAEKIAAADKAVMALKAALDGATHLSESEKAMYQTQLEGATETVRMAQTGMDKEGRMTAQRSTIADAVTMARTAVAGVNDDSTDSEVSAAENAIAALKKAIADAEDLPEGDTDVASAKGTLATLEPQLAAAKKSRLAAIEKLNEEEGEAMAALGKAMHAALAGTGTNTTALANIDLTSRDTDLSDGLTITRAQNAGANEDTSAPAAVILEAGDSAGSLGGWMGTNYAHTDTGTKVMNQAVVYTNRGAAARKPFSGTGGVYTLTSGQTDRDDNGYLGSDAATLLDVSAVATDLAKVRANAFTHSGTNTHTVPTGRDGVYVRGTYDGAPGEFRCATGCSSTNDGTGSPTALGGTWHFKPDSGAMVSVPDAHYLYYGWWLNKDKDGKPMAASAFTGRAGTEANDDNLNPGWTGNHDPASPGMLTGSATYAGHAAGKVAINNVLEGSGSGGHFTADANLTAKFSGTGAGVTGTIDSFMVDGAAMPWSVALHMAGFGSDGAITAPVNDTGTPNVDESKVTTWSINGNAAPRSGTWSGMMYDEAVHGDADDGSNLPTTVTGTFYSEFSTIGRMVGAFGADKQ